MILSRRVTSIAIEEVCKGSFGDATWVPQLLLKQYAKSYLEMQLGGRGTATEEVSFGDE
jgi:hypothetical protein